MQNQSRRNAAATIRPRKERKDQGIRAEWRYERDSNVLKIPRSSCAGMPQDLGTLLLSAGIDITVGRQGLREPNVGATALSSHRSVAIVPYQKLVRSILSCVPPLIVDARFSKDFAKALA